MWWQLPPPAIQAGHRTGDGQKHVPQFKRSSKETQKPRACRPKQKARYGKGAAVGGRQLAPGGSLRAGTSDSRHKLQPRLSGSLGQGMASELEGCHLLNHQTSLGFPWSTDHAGAHPPTWLLPWTSYTLTNETPLSTGQKSHQPC